MSDADRLGKRLVFAGARLAQAPHQRGRRARRPARRTGDGPNKLGEFAALVSPTRTVDAVAALSDEPA